MNSGIERLLSNNPYKEIPRLTPARLEEVSDISRITNVFDFDPEGDSEGNSQRWPVISKSVLIRDNYTCRVCGKSDFSNFSTADLYNRIHFAVQVHHIIPKKDGGKETFRNLVTLCEDCHRKTFSNDYAGLPVKNQMTIYRFEASYTLSVQEEWLDGEKLTPRNGTLRDYVRAYDTSTGNYSVITQKGETLNLNIVDVGSQDYKAICERAHTGSRATDYTTLIAETGKGKENVRILLNDDGELLL